MLFERFFGDTIITFKNLVVNVIYLLPFLFFKFSLYSFSHANAYPS